jgi:hypothetical protein
MDLIQLHQSQCAGVRVTGGLGLGCQHSQSLDTDTDRLDLISARLVTDLLSWHLTKAQNLLQKKRRST